MLTSTHSARLGARAQTHTARSSGRAVAAAAAPREAGGHVQAARLACASASALLLNFSDAALAAVREPLLATKPTSEELIQVEEELAAGVLLIGLPCAAAMRVATTLKKEQSADKAPSDYSVSGGRRSAVDISPRRSSSAFLSTLFAPDVDPNSPVSTVMTRNVIRGRPSQSVASALASLATCTGLVVVADSNDAEVVGVFSKHDGARAEASDTIGQHMTSPALTIVETTTVMDVAALMLKHEVHRLPVVDARGALTGIVTRSDIFQALLNKYRMEENALAEAAQSQALKAVRVI